MNLKTPARFLAAVAVLASVSASAAQLTTGKITSVNVNADGWVRITMVGSPSLCAVPKAGTPNTVAEFSLTASPETARGLLATLNAAKLANRSIDFWTDNGTGAYGCRVVAVTLL